MEQVIKFLGSLQSYFNDFIGSIAPALIFYSLLLPALGHTGQLGETLGTAFGEFRWLAAVAGLYATGHILTGLAMLLRGIATYLRKGSQANPPVTSPAEQNQNHAFLAVRDLVARAIDPNNGAQLSQSEVRSIAMTMSADGEELGRRFRFISAFCASTGIAVLLLGIVNLHAFLDHARSPQDSMLILGGCVLVFLILRHRSQEFLLRAHTVPFEAALGDVVAAKLGIKGTSEVPPGTSHAPPNSSGTNPPEAPDEFPTLP